VSEKGHTQTDDHGQHLDGPGSNVSIRLIGMDRPFVAAVGIAIAIALAIVALWYGMQAEREARLAEYYNIDLEMYVAKQGLTPPPDPWRHKEGKNP
jgi:hypothetical protein